jgi:hypothetical protein
VPEAASGLADTFIGYVDPDETARREGCIACALLAAPTADREHIRAARCAGEASVELPIGSEGVWAMKDVPEAPLKIGHPGWDIYSVPSRPFALCAFSE